MAQEPMKWVKFKVSESESKEAHIAFAKTGERWILRWYRKLFVRAVRQEEKKP
jgi:hypothetical protein